MPSLSLSALLRSKIERWLRLSIVDPVAQEFVNILEGTVHKGIFPSVDYLVKSGNYTVDFSTDNRKKIILTGAAIVTLPTPRAVGDVIEVLNVADNTVSVACASKLITDGNAAASSVAFSTASHRIGAHVIAECIDSDGAGALKYIVSIIGGPGVIATIS
jgi:hypothetical protein